MAEFVAVDFAGLCEEEVEGREVRENPELWKILWTTTIDLANGAEGREESGAMTPKW